MAVDWSQCTAVESIPGKLSGAWVFRGTRLPVSVVIDNLSAGLTVDEVVEQFAIGADQVREVLRFVSRSLESAPGFAA